MVDADETVSLGVCHNRIPCIPFEHYGQLAIKAWLVWVATLGHASQPNSIYRQTTLS
jgi:hypothetical protein